MTRKKYVWDFESEPLTLGTQTFAQNLEFLLKKTGTRNATVCDELNLSRTQFSRLITGRSHPKPHTIAGLEKMFGIDARILTHRIVECQPAEMTGYQRISSVLKDFGFFNESNQGSGFMEPDETSPEDGLYKIWFDRVFVPGEFYQSMARIKKVNGVKSFEMRDFRNDWAGLPDPGGAIKKHIGICFKLQEGFSTLHFIPNSNVNLYSTHRRISWLRSDRYLGLGMWNFSSNGLDQKVQRLAMEKVADDPKSVIQAARSIGVCNQDDLPDFALEHLLKASDVTNAA